MVLSAACTLFSSLSWKMHLKPVVHMKANPILVRKCRNGVPIESELRVACRFPVTRGVSTARDVSAACQDGTKGVGGTYGHDVAKTIHGRKHAGLAGARSTSP